MINNSINEGYNSDSDQSDSCSYYLSFLDDDAPPPKESKLREASNESKSSLESLENNINEQNYVPSQPKAESNSITDFLEYQGIRLDPINTANPFNNQDPLEDFEYKDFTINNNDILDEIEPSIDSKYDNIRTCNEPIGLRNVGIEESINFRKPYHSETKKSMSRRENNPLLEFFDDPTSSMKKGKNFSGKKINRKHPKKEYYRVKLLRAWKKALRIQINKRINKELTEPEIEFKQHAKRNIEILCYTGKTENGPLTEAQSKRIKDEIANEKTFNNKYVQELFACEIKRRSFELYVNSLFYNKSCEDLNKRFFFMCCNNNIHDTLCKEKWERLRKFTFTRLLDSNLELSC